MKILSYEIAKHLEGTVNLVFKRVAFPESLTITKGIPIFKK